MSKAVRVPDIICVAMSQQQYDTLLAAMRHYQHGLDNEHPHAEAARDEIAACTARPLTSDEIDILVEDWQIGRLSEVGGS